MSPRSSAWALNIPRRFHSHWVHGRTASAQPAKLDSLLQPELTGEAGGQTWSTLSTVSRSCSVSGFSAYAGSMNCLDAHGAAASQLESGLLGVLRTCGDGPAGRLHCALTSWEILAKKTRISRLVVRIGEASAISVFP